MVKVEDIKELREKTGVSMASCKKALEESSGNLEEAMQILMRESAGMALKKADRELNAGTLDAYVHTTKSTAVLVDLRSETDFVSKNEEFVSLAHDLAVHIAALNPSSVPELLEQEYVKDSSLKVGDLIKKAIQKFGENISIARFVRYSLSDPF